MNPQVAGLSASDSAPSEPSTGHAPAPRAGDTRYFLWMCLMALGVVFGDIGTSPLYAMRECFHGSTALAVSEANVLGVLSLVCGRCL